MANGSFHGDLLSDHETTIVSLTHPISTDFEETAKGESKRLRTRLNLRAVSLLLPSGVLLESVKSA